MISNTSKEQQAIPARILHTMLRVSDLDRSVSFYENTLAMQVFTRETFTEGRFTLVFMGYGNAASNPSVELTYNWDQDDYQQGSAYGHIALQVGDIYAACARLVDIGVNILRAPGPMNHKADQSANIDTIAFIEDPDGYKIELIQAK
ncbi:MAG: lactoylglutathione lyase [Pseudomonadales bacterium]|nr:lactoylglutathione lyase [Pseudomonadales bacterium]